MPAVRSRSTRRVAALSTIAVLAMVALTGCIKVDAVVGIAPDATASGTFAVAFQKEAASFLGISDLDSFDMQISDGALDEDLELAAFNNCATSETDASYVYTCTFANAEFTSPDDPWQIAKEGDEIVFTMKSEGSDAESQEMLGDVDLGSIAVDVEFPGPITSLQGEFVEQISDSEAKIRAGASDAFDITIRSETGGGGMSIAVLIVVLLAVVVAIVLVVAVVLLVMRRRAGTTAPPAAPVDAAAAAAATTAAAPEAAAPAAPPAPPAAPAAPEAAAPAAPPAPPAAPAAPEGEQPGQSGTTPPA